MQFSFSIKTLLLLVAAVATTIVGSERLHELYCLQELNRRAVAGDGCSVVETLSYASDRGFREDWSDGTWAAAAARGDCYILRILVEVVDDVDRQLHRDRTALMIAAENGHFNATKYLLVVGADANARTPQNKTALDLARANEHLAVAALISAVQQDRWDTIQRVESLVESLRRHAAFQSREAIEEGLEDPQAASLVALRVNDEGLDEDAFWFQASDTIRIGTTPYKSFYTWLIDGERVENVQFFSPPRN